MAGPESNTGLIASSPVLLSGPSSGEALPGIGPGEVVFWLLSPHTPKAG